VKTKCKPKKRQKSKTTGGKLRTGANDTGWWGNEDRLHGQKAVCGEQATFRGPKCSVAGITPVFLVRRGGQGTKIQIWDGSATKMISVQSATSCAHKGGSLIRVVDNKLTTTECTSSLRSRATVETDCQRQWGATARGCRGWEATTTPTLAVMATSMCTKSGIAT
jgi:hypothetical protein